MMEKHATMMEIARVLSPADPAPDEVVEHIEHCDRCLRLFDGLTQSEERMDIYGLETPPCDHESEIYNLYYGLDEIPDSPKEKLQRIYKRSDLLSHIDYCDYCTHYVQFLKMSAVLPDPSPSPLREAAAIIADVAARYCFDFLSVFMGRVPQPQLSAMFMAANANKEIVFDFSLGSFDAVLSYKPMGGTLTINRREGDEIPGITVYTDGEKRLENDQKGWDEVTSDQLICTFSTEKINLLHVAGCPVIETVTYSVLSNQKNILNAR